MSTVHETIYPVLPAEPGEAEKLTRKNGHLSFESRRCRKWESIVPLTRKNSGPSWWNW